MDFAHVANVAYCKVVVFRVECFDCCLFSGTMSTATSRQLPKDDEEEEDEEQGEEFEFDDSTDEEKTQADREGIHSRMLMVSERPEPLKDVPPAGQEGTVPVPTTGKTHF